MVQVAEISVESLYRKETKIHPRTVTGTFARLRLLAVVVLLGLYYGIAWIQWNGRQAVLFDLPERKFHIFGLTLWPQDFVFLAVLLIIAGLALFFFTAIAGRLWCGYACPQTVWTEAFILMERWVEGDRAKRIKLDKSPWNFNKIWRKSLKQFLWISFSVWTGLTFVGYFTPIRELVSQIITFTVGGWALFWVLFYAFATYGNAGFLREQVCKYMCPYARFQSAMFDESTLIVSYDTQRGEPRGSRKRGTDAAEQGLGSCIDCTLCVQVCPTGIDIRNGLQSECIACAACIDVCDQVMDKMHYPKGLIRYTSENELEGKTSSILRPRVLIYGALLSILCAGLIYSIATRDLVIAKLVHDKNALYKETDGGHIENSYTLRLVNKTEQPHNYRISSIEPEYIEIDRQQFSLNAAESRSFAVRLLRDANIDSALPVTNVTLQLKAVDDEHITTELEAKFLGPH